MSQRAASPGAPPREILSRHRVPPIQRVAPALTLRRHRIRGYTCDHRGLKVIVQKIEVGASPTIRAVVRDKNRQIAHDRHAALIGIALQR